MNVKMQKQKSDRERKENLIVIGKVREGKIK